MTLLTLDDVAHLINLAQPRLGAEAVACSDDFFAPMARMLNPEDPVFIPGKYDDNGKWMDGWESRRKREEGHDWCVVKLGLPGRLSAVEFDTRHFTGNYAPAASLEGCYAPDGQISDQTQWFEVLPAVGLSGNDRKICRVSCDQAITHVRLNIFPDGGVARLRLYGTPLVDWTARATSDGSVDLASLMNGGRPIAANDAHFGKPENLLAPGRGVNMGDGWETRRRREPGNDWCIIALGTPGIIEKIEVDTAHFKGNFPAGCSVQGALVTDGTEDALITRSMFWSEVMTYEPLSMDAVHSFPVTCEAPVSHIRFNIFPDGGVSRLRVWGQPVYQNV